MALRHRAADAASSFAHLFGRSRAETPPAAPPEKAEGEEEDEEDETTPPAPPPTAEDEEGEEDEELKDEEAPAARARARERARCAAILGHAAAARVPAMAMRLAFGTPLPRAQACALLDAGAESLPTGLSAKMSGAATRVPPDAPPATAKAAVASSWDRALAAAHVTKPAQ